MATPAEDGLEHAYQRERREAEAGLAEADHLEPIGPFEEQIELPLRGEGCDDKGRGGFHDARMPQIEHLARIAALVRPRYRWGTHGSDLAELSAQELAAHALRAHWHRGRKRTLADGTVFEGPTLADYRYQREWSRARSASASWFMRSAARAHRLPSVPPALAERLGRSLARMQLVGMLLDAMRGGWLGVTASGPELSTFLSKAPSTVWDAIRWLEVRGLIVRVRRYKPGRDGRPVELAANWYGAGPVLLDHAEEWINGELGEYRELRRERIKRRARLRRRRRRGAPGGFVDRATWVEAKLEAAADLERHRHAIHEIEVAELARDESLVASLTWTPPPSDLPFGEGYQPPAPSPITGAQAEVAELVAAVADELGEAELVAQAEAATGLIAGWRQRTGRDDDGDEGYALAALVEQRGQALAELDRLERLERDAPELAPAGDFFGELHVDAGGELHVDAGGELHVDAGGELHVDADELHVDVADQRAEGGSGPSSGSSGALGRRRGSRRPSLGVLRDTIRVSDGPPGYPENWKDADLAERRKPDPRRRPRAPEDPDDGPDPPSATRWTTSAHTARSNHDGRT